MATIKIPSKLKVRLDKEHAIIIDHNLIDFSHLLKEDKLFFFPEYTDHGINHIEGVLKSIEKLISDDTFKKLSSLDICAIIIATVLHDIGMHTSPEMFKNMIMGEYDHIPGNLFVEKTWKELWTEYLKDCRYWNQEKKDNVFGEKDYIIKEPNIDDLQSFNEYDKKFIGEFIRIHHARLAYEIALKGFIGKEKIAFDFSKNHDLNNEKFIQVAGLVARSHGMNIRDTFDYMKLYGKDLWKKPLGIKVIFLMTLIRLADYIQIDASRADELTLKLRVFYSQYSLREHKTHLAIDYVHFDNDDKEKILVEASPKDAKMYVKIDNLILDIQKEFDLSWAILGEVYENQYKLRYRRVESNLTDKEVRNGYGFVPNQFGFKFNNKLFELLIAPLYDDNPNYGVRELVQNAVDACRTRMALDEEYNAKENFTHVTVSLDPEKKLFSIVDTGIGMNTEEIEKYFLAIGSSYSSSIDWQRTRDDMNKDSNNMFYRTGRFGIGILAAFLLGPIIHVKTKRYNSEQGYQFTLRLDKDFIQIDKVYLPDYGTSIEIECNNEALERLIYHVNYGSDEKKYLGSYIWFGWYIDSKPKVEYRCQGKKIELSSERLDGYKPLKHKLSRFGDIYWRPRAPFIEAYGVRPWGSRHRPELYINGFFITQDSSKLGFSITGLEKFISPDIIIPDLKVTDILNELPLNLRRDNIDAKVEYPFEKDLAIALCKDHLCQLLAIDWRSFKNKNILFFHHSGYSMNIRAHDSNVFDELDLYQDECLLGKTLVHIFYDTCFDDYKYCFHFHPWEQFMSTHPKVILSFSDSRDAYSSYSRFIEKKRGYGCSESEISRYKHKHCSIVVSKSWDYKEDQIINLNDMIMAESIIDSLKEYRLVRHDSLNSELVKDILSLLGSLQSEVKLNLFMIHRIEGTTIASPLDDFINEYAGGDIIIPYDETERRKKFAKLYTECRDEIERYRAYYQDDRFK